MGSQSFIYPTNSHQFCNVFKRSISNAWEFCNLYYRDELVFDKIGCRFFLRKKAKLCTNIYQASRLPELMPSGLRCKYLTVKNQALQKA